MLDQFTHLHRFAVIVEAGSMHKAAARLSLTQPALSRSIGILEASFGRALLERHARGVRPTPFGERVLVTVRRLSRQWEVAQSELGADPAEEPVTLKLGIGPIWRSGMIAPVFETLRRRHPNLLIEVSPLRDGGVPSELNEGRLDMALGGARLDAREHPQVAYHPLVDITVEICARAGHPVLERLRPDDPASEACLLDYPWIAYTEMALYADETDYSISHRLGREPDVWMKSSNLLTVLTTLQRSDSLCVLSDRLIGTLTSPPLVPVPIDLRRRKFPLGLFYREEIADWVIVRDFLALCRQHLGAGTGAAGSMS